MDTHRRGFLAASGAVAAAGLAGCSSSPFSREKLGPTVINRDDTLWRVGVDLLLRITNTESGARGELHVGRPEGSLFERRDSIPASIGTEVDPERVEAVSGQEVAYRIDAPGRVVVELASEEDAGAGDEAADERRPTRTRRRSHVAVHPPTSRAVVPISRAELARGVSRCEDACRLSPRPACSSRRHPPGGVRRLAPRPTRAGRERHEEPTTAARSEAL